MHCDRIYVDWQVLVEAEAKSRVARALDEANLKHSVEVPDVLALVEEERAHMQAKRRKKRESGEAGERGRRSCSRADDSGCG